MPALLNNHVFAFDLDGTVYTGDTLIKGADEVVYYLRRHGVKVVFFTNSSTRTVRQVYDKLTRLGLEPELEDVHTSAHAAAIYASSESITNAYCVGTDGLRSELQSFDIKVLDTAETAEALVIGLDPEFNYKKLAAVMPCRDNGCKIIACNRDRNYPVENNILMPGCGPIVAAIEDAIDRKVDFFPGKPNTYMLDLLIQELGCSKSEITVVGDSRESDIQMAMNYGVKSFLISSAVHTDIHDTMQVADIKEIIKHV